MSHTDYEKLLDIQKRKLSKALQHLKYSYEKVVSLPDDVEKLDEESLETWESFAARFSRVVEIFLMRYLRTSVLMQDPGFVGSLRDFVNQGEKLGLLTDSQQWMALRELRNITAHDYSEKDISAFFKRLKHDCPILFEITTH